MADNKQAERRRLMHQAKARNIEVPRGASNEEIDRLISEKFRADHEAIRNFKG